MTNSGALGAYSQTPGLPTHDWPLEVPTKVSNSPERGLLDTDRLCYLGLSGFVLASTGPRFSPGLLWLNSATSSPQESLSLAVLPKECKLTPPPSHSPFSECSLNSTEQISKIRSEEKPGIHVGENQRYRNFGAGRKAVFAAGNVASAPPYCGQQLLLLDNGRVG